MAARRGDAIVALVAICAALATLPDARVHGFKANDFKKCETSSFCQRLRDRPDGATREIYSIEGRWEPIGGRGGGWGALLAKAGEPRPLRVELTPYGDEGVVRLRVDEPAHPRYVVPGVLVDDLSPSEFADVQFASGGKDGDGARTVFLTKNPDVDVVVTHAPFRVAVRVRGHETTVFNRRSLFEFEYKRDAPAEGESWSESFNSHTDSRPNGPTALAFDVTFPDAEHVYGIPERATSLSLKETKDANGQAVTEPYRMYNLDVFEYLAESPFGLYGSIPVMLAHAKVGGGGAGGRVFGTARARALETVTSAVYFNNPTETYVDVSKSRVSSGFGGKKVGQSVDALWMAESGSMDVFVAPGPTPAAVIRQYTSLTGTTRMPPSFALGYHQCRWNYRDEKDVAEVDAGFDRHDIPYDVLWLDIEHTDGKRYMTWDAGKFPTPRRMIEDVASRGRKMVTIVDPHVKKDGGYPIFKEAEAKNFYVKKADGSTDFDGWCWPGSSAYLDVTSPTVRDWWAGKFALDQYEGSTKDLYIWNDMNEPSVFNGPEVTMQKDLVHAGGVEHREVHNAFGMYYHAATAEGIARRNDERPFVLSRAFFAGTQRIGPIWTGDNAADWDHLRVSIPMVTTLGLTGLTFSGADVGGFFGNPDAELMTRWYQIGIYYPFFRGHAHLETKRREPWLFGSDATRTIRDAIRRRYQLMPYLYTLFEAAHREGSPVLRPLWYEFPDDPSVWAREDAVMLGPAILVHPVLVQGADAVDVALPEGVWYDFDTGESHVGPKRWKYPVTIADVPTFVRGGHIVPRRDRPRRSTAAMRRDPLTLVVAPDADGDAVGEVYLDDGVSFEHETREAFVRRALTFSRHKELRCSAPTAASARAGGVEGSRGASAAGAGSGVDASGKKSVADVSVERVLILGAARHGGAVVNGEARDVVAAPASTRDGAPANAVAVRKPEVRIADDWTIALAASAGR